MTRNRRSPIIWAVDPFSTEDLNFQVNVIGALNAVCGPGDEILPMYVWDSAALGGAKTLSKVKEQAELIMSKWPKAKFSVPLLEIQVVKGHPGVVSCATTLAAHAKLLEAPFIAISRHTKGGVLDWVQGSFCESLGLVSSTPLLIVPPKWKTTARRNDKGILFPTDFSPASREAFEKVIELAKQKKLNITIYHKVEFPIFTGMDFSSPAPTDYFTTDREQISLMRAEAEKWAIRAREFDLHVDILVEGKRGIHAGTRILALAKRGYSVLAMAAHRTFFERLLMGSTSRFVSRSSPCPVLILRPSRPSRAAKKGDPKVRIKGQESELSGTYLV